MLWFCYLAGDGLDKDRLKALGMGAFASYGFISNLNYGTALGVAWLAFVKKYGVAPTAPGQWKVFLAFYAGVCEFVVCWLLSKDSGERAATATADWQQERLSCGHQEGSSSMSCSR